MAESGPGTSGDGPILDQLRSDNLDVVGRMRYSSNATFLVDLSAQTGQPKSSSDASIGLRGIYKPAAGEQPLWDFPVGLWRREIAAYELSHAMGLDVVPPTVERVDGPFGPGSLQLFINARFEEHYFTLHEMADPAIDEQLRVLCAFDIVANSADRKSGHCLIDDNSRIWAIDNGLSFHSELKLRTVIWDFAGEPLPSRAVKALEDLCETGPPASLFESLDSEELDAMMLRARGLLASARFPQDPTGSRYPWPLV